MGADIETIREREQIIRIALNGDVHAGTALDVLLTEFFALAAERDSWRKVAREYEAVLIDRGLL